MDLKDIKELIGVMRKNRIREIDLDQDGTKIKIIAQEPTSRVGKTETVQVQQVPQTYLMPPASAMYPHLEQHMPSMPAAQVAPAVAPMPVTEQKPKEEFPGAVEVKAPMVGTFYRAPSPEAPSYVEVDTVVNPDTVLCIIEAMKLMNEIKSETRGKILKVLVENGQPIEFGQPLFLVEPF